MISGMKEPAYCPSEGEMEAEEVIGKLQAVKAQLLAALEALMAATSVHSRWCPACNCNMNVEHKEHYEPCAWTQACEAIREAKGS
ncbi:MAG: hypothetical protein A2V88_08745 [Elusimicrobia bacterium RBG_16_66_12]|nr:MAG: hypothetical protein A2V88_08745 [Elusimicrobia bacterium RBG_16_66_12]